MDTSQLQQRLAYLEFVHDQLETEVTELDLLLRSIGFPQGLSSIKEIAHEILAHGDIEDAA